MSKAQSTQLKGIAILMMLFLHLFNHWTPGEYTPWFFYNPQNEMFRRNKTKRSSL